MKMCRLEQIRQRCNGRVRIVAHGTNGWAPELMKQCIAAGVSKININRLILNEYYGHLHANTSKLSHTVLIEEGTAKVIEETVRWAEICGSAGKA